MVWKCYDDNSPPLYIELAGYVYLALLQLVGIVFAFQTRRVKIRALNESKFVVALVYISSIVLITIVLIKFILGSYIHITAVMFNGGVLILATSFLCFTFLPKVLCDYVCKDNNYEPVPMPIKF